MAQWSDASGRILQHTHWRFISNATVGGFAAHLASRRSVWTLAVSGPPAHARASEPAHQRACDPLRSRNAARARVVSKTHAILRYPHIMP